jgi:hypothetical protein
MATLLLLLLVELVVVTPLQSVVIAGAQDGATWTGARQRSAAVQLGC